MPFKPFSEKQLKIKFLQLLFTSITLFNKAYRPNAHLLYIVMPYNGSII